MFFNMKIEVNEDQPIGQIVEELERLGYEPTLFTPNRCTAFIVCYESGSFTDWDKFDGGYYDWKPTSLLELEEMKCSN